MYVRVQIPRPTWAIRGGQVLLIGLGLVAATTAFRCPGPEPAATGAGGAGGSGGAGATTDSSSSTGTPTCDADLTKDVLHCGACGHACSNEHALPGMTFCNQGQCVPLCPPPFFDIEHPQAPEADDGCETQGKLVFVSQAPTPPNIMGLQGADALCQGWATEAGVPPGTFKAWLSDSTTSAASRLTHHDGPYIRPDAQIVADNWADLTDGSLKVGIDMTEFHMPLPVTATNLVWTGTNEMGDKIGPYCNDWGVTSMDGVVGVAGAVGPDWTKAANPNSCFNENVHLYCIEQ